MSERNISDPVQMSSRVDSHEVLDWTAVDIHTEEETSWPTLDVAARVDSITFLDPLPAPVLVLRLVPPRPMVEMDQIELAGDVKLLRYALDEYDRSLGGSGFALTQTEQVEGTIVLTLVPLHTENSGDRLPQIVRMLESSDSRQALASPDAEAPEMGLVLVRPRFGQVHAEIAHPSKT